MSYTLVLNAIYPAAFLILTVVIILALKYLLSRSMSIIWTILPIKSQILDRLVDFSYQLPNLVMHFKRSKRLEDTRSLFMKLIDNKTLAFYSIFKDLLLTMLLFNGIFNLIILSLGFALVIAA